MAVDVQSRAQRHDRLAVGKRSADSTTHLTLLGTFQLTRAGTVVALPAPTQRLVAFLAIRGQTLSRSQVAGNLWIEAGQERALANLRSAVWRARRCEPTLLEIDTSHIRLAGHIEIDVHGTCARARRLIEDVSSCEDDEMTPAGLTGELLPEWDDDWVIFERERLRQLFLHALESLSRRLSALGRHALAVEASTALVQQEPLRETAHIALIAAHLAEGNRNEALCQYRAYLEIMRSELGLEPSPRVETMLEHALHRLA